jgi:hypothetical protein
MKRPNSLKEDVALAQLAIAPTFAVLAGVLIALVTDMWNRSAPI